jgi:hypothetical protein
MQADSQSPVPHSQPSIHDASDAQSLRTDASCTPQWVAPQSLHAVLNGPRAGGYLQVMPRAALPSATVVAVLELPLHAAAATPKANSTALPRFAAAPETQRLSDSGMRPESRSFLDAAPAYIPALRVSCKAPTQVGRGRVVPSARLALSARDPNGVLREMDEYDRLPRTHVLDAEATMLRIEALVQAGRTTESAERARTYLSLYPASPHRARLQQIAGE